MPVNRRHSINEVLISPLRQCKYFMIIIFLFLPREWSWNTQGLELYFLPPTHSLSEHIKSCLVCGLRGPPQSSCRHSAPGTSEKHRSPCENSFWVKETLLSVYPCFLFFRHSVFIHQNLSLPTKSFLDNQLSKTGRLRTDKQLLQEWVVT